MSDFEWNNYTQTGDWVQFKEVGDGVIGVIKAIREGQDFNQNPCPELIIETDDGEEKTLTAGQVMLKAALAEKAPQVGDKIRVVYSSIGVARPGKAPAKMFTVDVKPGPHEVKNPNVANSVDPL
jgi:hypothetical protein